MSANKSSTFSKNFLSETRTVDPHLRGGYFRHNSESCQIPRFTPTCVGVTNIISRIYFEIVRFIPTRVGFIRGLTVSPLFLPGSSPLVWQLDEGKIPVVDFGSFPHT